jgi:MFS family permease
MPTALQSVLLAFHASVYALAPAAVFAGFGFACGGVVWDTALQRSIAPEKVARVAAYGWMSAMVFLPAGYALAGPIASLVGMRGYLLFGAVWLVASTLVIYRVPSVRDFRSEKPAPESAPLAAVS